MQKEKQELPSPVKESLVRLACYTAYSVFCDEYRSQNFLWCSEKAGRALGCIRPGFMSSTIDEGFVSFLSGITILDMKNLLSW